MFSANELHSQLQIIKKQNQKLIASIKSLTKRQDNLEKRLDNMANLDTNNDNNKIATADTVDDTHIETNQASSQGSTIIIGIILFLIGLFVLFVGQEIGSGIISLIAGIILIIYDYRNKSIILDQSIDDTSEKLESATASEATEVNSIDSHEKNNSKKSVSIEQTTNKSSHKQIRSLEEDVGMRWFARIGILALVIGIGFFIKYAIDMNWINHLARIILGVSAGLILISFGQWMSNKKKYYNWALTLIGGGFASAYFSIYAAYHFVEYRQAIGISQTVDIILLSIIVIFAIAYSLKYDSQIIATESFFLGFITSLLSNDFGIMTIIYGMILTIGLVAVVSIKKWTVIGLFGLLASYGMYLLWSVEHPDSFSLSIFILLSYFICFSIQSFMLMGQKKTFQNNMVIIVANSIIFYVFNYIQVNNHAPGFTGLSTILISIFYLYAYYFCRFLKKKNYSEMHLYLALFYITLSIPIILNKEWITVIWALETVILTLMFVRFRINAFKYSSFVVATVTTIKTLSYDIYILDSFDPTDVLTSSRLFSYLFTIIAFYITYTILRRFTQLLNKEEKKMLPIYSWLASIFFILIIFFEFSVKYTLYGSLLLAIFMLMLLFISRLKNKDLFYQSVFISIFLFFKIIIYDNYRLAEFDLDSIFSSTRIISFIVGIIGFYIISTYLDYNQGKLAKSEQKLVSIYSHAGTTLSFVLILCEMEEMWISISWIALALTVMSFGFLTSKKYMRLQGMFILAITIIKVFLYDTRNLETIYRTISYIILGIILLMISFVYTRHKNKLSQELY